MLLKSLMTGDIHSRFGGRAVFKGGGGGSSTSSTGYTPEMQRLVEDQLSRANIRTKARQADPTLAVSSMTPQQEQALAQQELFGKQAIAGTGMYDTRASAERDLKNLMGSSLGASSGAGALGSARSERAMQSALADKASGFAQERQRVAELGVKNLGDAGTTRQQQAQAYLDAPDEATKDFFSYIGSAPRETKTTQSGGGK